ncbi:MAG: glycine cleavage system protein GcvH [Candidatus Saliniplasma sp.]
MVEVDEDLKYTEKHEWIKIDGEEITYGITDYAQEELGDIVYVELPMEGEEVDKGDVIGVVESVKTVSDLYAPISGTISAVNMNLEGAPEQINEDPFGEGWIAKMGIDSKSELEELLTAEEYKAETE